VTWDGATARAALSGVLEAAFAGTNVSVFPAPPSTFNAPALIVQYPLTVTKFVPSFGTDLAAWSVMAAVGLEQSDELDGLANDVAAAVFLDPSLGGAVQVAKVTELRNWRIVTTGAAELLSCEIALETRM
jgi:hypothetical protein